MHREGCQAKSTGQDEENGSEKSDLPLYSHHQHCQNPPPMRKRGREEVREGGRERERDRARDRKRQRRRGRERVNVFGQNHYLKP